jgi:hypothetical protein
MCVYIDSWGDHSPGHWSWRYKNAGSYEKVEENTNK